MELIYLLDQGIQKIEQQLNIENLYEPNERILLSIINAIRARYCYKMDYDYRIENNKIVILNEITNRPVPNGVLPQGIRQHVEYINRLPISKLSIESAVITIQRFFQKYHRISGMTATASYDEHEYKDIYGASVIKIPNQQTN